MVQKHPADNRFPSPRAPSLFQLLEPAPAAFLIQSFVIDWVRLQTKRLFVFDSPQVIPAYLFNPEIITLLNAVKHLTCRLVLGVTGRRCADRGCGALFEQGLGF